MLYKYYVSLFLNFVYFFSALDLCCSNDFFFPLSLWQEGATLVAERGLQSAQASVIAAPGLSSCGSLALEHRLSSGGTWTCLLQSMWDLPGSGKPMSPALAGGFFTTELPGKPLSITIIIVSPEYTDF